MQPSALSLTVWDIQPFPSVRIHVIIEAGGSLQVLNQEERDAALVCRAI